MKNLLKISLVAMLVASPLIARAEDPQSPAQIALENNTTPSEAVRYSGEYELEDVPVKTTDPVAPTADIASTSYVQGAYNEAVHIINQENKRALGIEAGLRNDITRLDGDGDNSVNKKIKTQAKDADYTNNSMSGITTISGAIDNLDTRLDTVESNATVGSGTYVAIEAGTGVASNLVKLDQAVAAIQTNDGKLTGDGNYIKQAQTVAQNLVGLDNQVKSNTDDIVLLKNTAATTGSVLNSVKTQAAGADYNHNTSQLTATTIQGAIDEVEGRVDTAEATIGTGSMTTAATTLKGAINELNAKVVQVRTTWGSNATAKANVIVDPETSGS